MACNNLTGITSCNSFAASGVRRITLFPFGDVFNYTYTDDNLNKVTNYQQLSLGAIYTTYSQTNLVGELSQSNTNVFTHTLTSFVPALSEDKRGEFEQLINMELTVIIEDNNGKAWIMGQDRPVMLTSYSLSTGGETNGYNFTLSGQSKHQVREIVRASDFCLFSFNGETHNQSTFTIADASLVDWAGLYEVQVNNTTNSNTFTPFDPTNWTNPTIYTRDRANFESLLGTNYNLDTFMYDSGTDEILIVITSSTDLYPIFALNGNQLNSIMTTTLNLSIVGGTLQSGSVITVTDSLANVVYSGQLADSISGGPYGLDVTGTVQDAWINVTNLYPAGTTFTATVTGACGLQVYTYVSPAIEGCSAEIEFSINEGRRYTMRWYKAEGYTYQKGSITIDGTVMTLYTDTADYHDSFGTFITDVTNIMTPLILPLDISSLTFIEQADWIDITFVGDNTDLICHTMNWGFTSANNGTPSGYVRGAYTRQSTVVALQSLVPTDSYITINDTAMYTLGGPFGQVPDMNSGFILEDVPTITDGTMNNIGFTTDNMTSETDTFTEYTVSPSCPDSTNIFDLTTCSEGFNKTAPLHYYLFKFSMVGISPNLGDRLFFETSDGDFDVIFPFNLTPGTAIDECTASFVGSIIKPHNVVYNPAEQAWYLELLVEDAYRIYNVYSYELVPPATQLREYTVHKYQIATQLNPFIQARWNFPTINGASMQQFNTEQLQETTIGYDDVQYQTAEFINNSAGTFDIDFTLNNTISNNTYVSFYGGVPNITYLLYGYTVGNPTTSVSFDIQADMGVDYNFITHVLITDDNGLYVVIPFDPATQSDITIPVYTYNRFTSYFGRFREFYVVYPDSLSHAATLVTTSVLCPTVEPYADFLWIEANDYDVNNADFSDAQVGDTVTFVQGDNFFNIDGIGTIGDILIGSYVRFGTSNNKYIVTDIAFPLVTLNIPIIDASATTNVDIAYFINLVDKSPLSRTVTQAASMDAGQLLYNQKNSYSSIHLGAKGVYDITPTLDLSTDKLGILAVMKQRNVVGDDIVYQYGTDGGNPRFNVKYDGGGAEIYAEATDSVGDFVDGFSGTVMPNVYQVTYAHFSYASSLQTVKTSTDGNTPDVATFNSNGVHSALTEVLGGRFDGAVYDTGFDGDIVELVMFSDTSDAIRQWNEGYLAWKYSLQAALPPSHPYYLNPPQ